MADQFAKDMITHDEGRRSIGYEPLIIPTPEEIENSYTPNMKPIKVEYTGFGFLSIKKGVLEKIKYPWFYPVPLEFSDCGDFYPEDIALFIPHQENKRIIDATTKKLGLNKSQVMINIEKY